MRKAFGGNRWKTHSLMHKRGFVQNVSNRQWANLILRLSSICLRESFRANVDACGQNGHGLRSRVRREKAAQCSREKKMFQVNTSTILNVKVNYRSEIDLTVFRDIMLIQCE